MSGETYAERYFSGERVSVIDDRKTIITIPAVQFHAATPTQQHLTERTHITQNCAINYSVC